MARIRVKGFSNTIGGSDDHHVTLVQLTINVDTEIGSVENYSTLKKVMRKVNNHLSDYYTMQDHVSSQYDCTGQVFGSNLKKIYSRVNSWDNSVYIAYEYSYSIDI